MTIPTRLNLLIGALLLVALCALGMLLIMRGASRAQIEEDAMMRAGEFIVHAAADRVKTSADPDRVVAAVLAQLRGLKHIKVSAVRRDQSQTPKDTPPEPDAFHNVANWLAGDDETTKVIRIALDNPQASVQAIELSPSPVDEMKEIVSEAADISMVAAIFLCGVFILTTVLVRRSLAPIFRLNYALDAMRERRYDVAVDAGTSPELASIASAVTELGKSLLKAQRETRALSVKLVSAQDNERREISRELHDEMGSNLFAIRARAAALDQKLSSEQVDAAAVHLECSALVEQLEALQVAHRHVLERLTPPGLKELGLKKALAGLVKQWRTNQPDVVLHTDISELEPLDDITQLTIYRVVQEGVTNALKYAAASEILITICVIPNEISDEKYIQVRIADDGRGFQKPTGFGFGLTNMRERLAALGGTLELTNRATGGTRLEALIPRSLY